MSTAKPGHAALGGKVLHSLQARVRASGWTDLARRGASFMPLGLMMLLDAWPSMIVVGVALVSSGLLFGADFARRRRGSYGALMDLSLGEDVLSIPRMGDWRQLFLQVGVNYSCRWPPGFIVVSVG